MLVVVVETWWRWSCVIGGEDMVAEEGCWRWRCGGIRDGGSGGDRDVVVMEICRRFRRSGGVGGELCDSGDVMVVFVETWWRWICCGRGEVVVVAVGTKWL